VVEAAINENPDLAGFIAQYKPPFPVGTANALAALKYLEWPPDKRPLVPLMVFIDRKGVMRALYSGLDADFFNEQGQNEDKNIRAEAEKFLNEKAAPPPGKKTGKKN